MTDRYIQALWRKAALKKYGEGCIRCGSHPVQCHHYIYRRVRVLRHAVENAFPLCVECHQMAHTKAGDAWLIDYMGKERHTYLLSMESVTLKQYLIDNGVSRNEWLDTAVTRLKDIIRGD